MRRRAGKSGAVHDQEVVADHGRGVLPDEDDLDGDGGAVRQQDDVGAGAVLLGHPGGGQGGQRTIGTAPGLLARLPGIKQLFQLRKLKGMGMEDVLGEDAAEIQRAMEGGGIDPSQMAAQMAGLPRGVQPRLPAGAMARARLMGYAPEPVSVESARDRDARKKKRKQERQARKKNRKRNKRR